MATDRIRYIDTGATGAGNGTSWADAYTGVVAALAGEVTNLTAADVRLVFYCRASTGVKDTVGTPVISSDWGTNYSNGCYILFLPALGHAANYGWDNSKYTLATTATGSVFRDFVFDNIQVELGKLGGSQQLLNLRGGGSNHREFKRCHVRYTGTGGTSNAFCFIGSNINLRLSNNIFRDFPQRVLPINRGGGTYYASDNTFINCATGIENSGAALPVVRGSLFHGTTNPLVGTFGAGSNNNATDQASLGYTVSGGGNTEDRVNQTFAFADAAGGNYAITTADTGAYQHGIDLRNDPTYPVTDTLSGALRGAVTSIGASDPGAGSPPALSGPDGSSTGESTATGAVTCDTAGADVWAYVSTSAAPPSVADHKSGNGAAATAFIDNSIAGVNNFSFTGLTQNTTYYAHFLASSNTLDSSQVTSPSFTTAAGLAIVSINGGSPIRRGATGVLVQWNQDATQTNGLAINGVYQSGYQTNVGGDATVTSFNLIWPNVAGSKYGVPLEARVNETYFSSVTILPPSGSDFIDLSGYSADAAGVVVTAPAGEAALENADEIEFEATDDAGNETKIDAQGYIHWRVNQPEDAAPFRVRAIDPDDGERSMSALIQFMGISSSTPTPGETVTITWPNLTSISTSAGAISFNSVDADTHTFVAPDPKVFGDKTLGYNTSIVLTLSNGSETRDITIQLVPPANHDLETIVTVGGVFVGNGNISVGDIAYGYFYSGAGVANLATGEVVATEPSTYRYWIKDADTGVWSDASNAVVSNEADEPQFSGPINAPMAQVSTSYSFSLSSYFSHPAGKALSYAFSNLPDGISQDSQAAAVINGTPTTEQTVTSTVTVSDPEGDSIGPYAFELRVNAPPVWGSIPAQEVKTGTAVSINLSDYVTDADTLTFTVDTLPEGLGLSGSLIEGTPTNNAVTTTTVTASDGSLSSSATINWTVTSSPTLVNNIPDQALAVGDAVNLDLSPYFTDPDQDPFTYSSTTLPSGLTLNSSTGLLSGTVTAATNSSVTFTATSGGESVDSNPVQFVVNDAPTFGGPIPDQYWESGDNISLNVSLYFLDQDVLFYAVNSGQLPAGATLNQTTGLVTGVAGEEELGSVVFSATDGQLVALSNTVAFQVNKAPEETATIPEQNLSISDAVSFNLNDYVSDLNDLTFTADTLPPGVALNDGVVSGQVTGAGTYETIFTVSDGVLSTNLTPVTWNVNAPPVFNGAIIQQNASVNAAFYFDASAFFSNPDGGPLFFTAEGLPSTLSINNNTGIITGTPLTSSSHLVTVTSSDGTDTAASNPFYIVVTSATQEEITATPSWRTMIIKRNQDGNGRMFSIDPDERLDYEVDLRRWLEADQIESVQWSASNGLAVVGGGYNNCQAKVWVQGVTDNSVHNVSALIETSAGRKLKAWFLLVGKSKF